ncbi:MAG: YbaB/EbfC family nucleoid-associated protein [Acidimicrobiales bacterium]
MSELLKQAQKMQEQLLSARDEAAEKEVEGQAGGGVVKMRVTGGMEFRSVSIDPSAVDPDDVGMLEDLILAAIHDGMAQAAKINDAAMGGFDLGGLGGGLLG